MSKTQAARRIGVSARTLDRLRKSGDGPPFMKIGGRFFYDEADIAAWLVSKRQGSCE